MSEVCLVFFRAGACDLNAAAKSLVSYGLTVREESDGLVVSRPDAPQFRVRLCEAPHVPLEAAEISAGTPHEAPMRDLRARFEIEIDDLDEALDEINTLMEVQGALQDASQGYLFTPWNGNLLQPWRA